jgi:pre-mRNA-splicing factor RBM22/SLT11
MSVNNDPRLAADGASEFPILCETCLGPSLSQRQSSHGTGNAQVTSAPELSFVRMLKDKWGRPCKVCERPFQTFRWNPAGAGMRYKNTEICQTCARVKNVCQTCLLDLSYGLPVQVRDAGMAAADRQVVVVPSSDTMRQYAAAQADRSIAAGAVDAVYDTPVPNPLAQKNKRVDPRYERNRAQLCSWFAKGKCARGLYCPYRHEMPKDKDHPFAQQNLRDRYYGVNDPVAASILARSATSHRPRPGQKQARPPPHPEDPAIMSFFIGGLSPSVTEQVLLALFRDHSNDIVTVRLLPEKSIAFIDFSTRQAAEKAMDEFHGQIDIADAKITISWARGSSSGKRSSHNSRPASTVKAGMYTKPLPDISGIIPNVQPPPAVLYYGRTTVDNSAENVDGEPSLKRARILERRPKKGDDVRDDDTNQVVRQSLSYGEDKIEVKESLA